jgi:3,4-dihydroxy 2-butanone 4-phosphate synthase/GTP cyclohydrolase II
MSHEFSPIEHIIEDLKQGRQVVLVDDEDRENEGDLIVAASHCTPDAVNFMARFGRGLICLALTSARVQHLRLPLQPQSQGRRFETAFTVSIEARDGVTTGISAADRAHTIAAAIAPDAQPEHLITPGHVFPLIARDGGVLVRAGHTEASVDLARLAGLEPAAVICEIMNDDGTMARRADLELFAKKHGLNIGTIADLIRYRRQKEQLIQEITQFPIADFGGIAWQAVVFRNIVTGTEHLALKHGSWTEESVVPTRMHRLDILGDVFNGTPGKLDKAAAAIKERGFGVLVVLREMLPDALSRSLQEPLPASPILREYGIGAQILQFLGVRRLELLGAPAKNIAGLDGFGLDIVKVAPL